MAEGTVEYYRGWAIQGAELWSIPRPDAATLNAALQVACY